MSDTLSSKTIVNEIDAIRQRDLQIEKVIVETPRGATFKLRGPDGAYAFKLSSDDRVAKQDSSVRSVFVQREAAILQNLSGFTDNLYVEHGVRRERYWLLLNWIGGKHAASLGKAIKQRGGEKVKQAIVQLFIKLAAKVSELHKLGYIHGDLQPSHLIQDASGKIHLVDFGLSKLASEKSDYYTGGLVHFDPPETAQAILDEKAKLPLDILTDIYSFGSVLFFVYTGATSTFYGSDDYRSLPMKQMLRRIADGDTRTFRDAQAAPFPELEEVLKWCTHVEREKRCANLEDIILALQPLA